CFPLTPGPSPPAGARGAFAGEPRTGVRGCELWLLVSREDPKAASHKFGDRFHCDFPSRLRVFA
ncbi:MAG: hypothetical protein ACK56X_19765, partial [Planctomyces sp.]